MSTHSVQEVECADVTVCDVGRRRERRMLVKERGSGYEKTECFRWLRDWDGETVELGDEHVQLTDIRFIPSNL